MGGPWIWRVGHRGGDTRVATSVVDTRQLSRVHAQQMRTSDEVERRVSRL